MAEGRSREVKVGIFTTALVVLGAGTVFVLGGASDLLEDRYTLNASWADVAGLKEGAVVRLAGWDVGEVAAIQFSDDLGVKEIFVELDIMAQYQPRIREDSEARIDTVGVLGDKYVAITMGDPDTPVLDDDDWITTRAPLDIISYTKQVTDILQSAENISRKVDLMLGDDQEAAQASLSESFKHIEEILHAAKTGDGLITKLVYDKGLADRTDAVVANLEGTTATLESVTNEIRHGDGIATELIYGDDGAALAEELRVLAGALGELSSDIKNEDSLINAMIYDPTKKQMVEDLALTAAALRETTQAINAGEGTAGLLARDPALYEDLRALVGGAQRNKLLRAYIRRTVEKGEQEQSEAWTPQD